MTAKRRRGRPFKDGLPDVPDHLKGRSKVENPFASALTIYKEYIHNVRGNESPIISDQVLIDRAESWQCSADEVREIEASYTAEVAKAKKGIQYGAKKTADIAHHRAHAICNKNKDLLKKIRPNGMHTINSIAAIIWNEWDKRAPKPADYPSEHRELVNLPQPCMRTIRTYIKKFLLSE